MRCQPEEQLVARIRAFQNQGGILVSFVDYVKIFATAGAGGNGCASIRREKYKPLAGPDGGAGGHGGSIILRVDPQVTTLLEFHHRPHVSAENGLAGAGDYRDGKRGEDLVLPVPLGTVVTSETGELLADLGTPEAEYTLARGGVGGLGNWGLASAKRKAPGFALLGEPGEERTVILELKSVADVALVGFPSAGKSSLVAALSAAKPKIADYPFTTLVPNLAVVDSPVTRFTMADVPGLIPGAAQGKGLGLDFLRHIERCCVLAHVVDLAAWEPERDPLSDIRALESELAAYASDLDRSGQVSAAGSLPPLMERRRAVILNKIDVPDGREMAEVMRADLGRLGWPIFEVSAATHEGLKDLSLGLSTLVKEFRESGLAPHETVRPILRPNPKPARGEKHYSITSISIEDRPGFQIRGDQVERWVKQTDFTNDEAVGYLADRLANAGVEDDLLKSGARAGDTVIIGDPETGVIFDWEPTLQAGAELLGARGTDSRLYESGRRSNQQRRIDYHAWMDAKRRAREELAQERESGKWVDPE